MGVLQAFEGGDDVASEPFCEDELVLIPPPDGAWKDRQAIPLAELKHLALIPLHAGSATRAALEGALTAAKTRLADLRVVAQFGRTNAL